MTNTASVAASLLLGAAASQPAFAADHPLSISGYLEPYYAWDSARPRDHERPPFLYNFDRAGEVDVNLALLRAAYDGARFRAAGGLAVGSYMDTNYAAEPSGWQNVFEASVGLRLRPDADLWLDAGVFPSHLGFESAIGADNWALTRSLAAENSPYYEAGLKLGYRTPDGRWFVSGLLLQGWQRINRVDGNDTPAFGLQVTWQPSQSFAVNYSSFIGSDQPDDERRMRYFHNLYGTFRLSPSWDLTVGLDVGAEQVAKGSSSYHHWVTPQVVVRHSVSDRLKLAGRVEYYDDRNGVIISPTGAGFRTLGFSVNVDYAFRDNVLGRLEARTFASREPVFTERDGSLADGNTAVTASLAVSF
ncbi:MAG: porin [Chromatiales bacterium]|jgi:hypothetical protein|nr:porin [Chromatiales bacterium]